jgi:hypothetical protein
MFLCVILHIDLTGPGKLSVGEVDQCTELFGILVLWCLKLKLQILPPFRSNRKQTKVNTTNPLGSQDTFLEIKSPYLVRLSVLSHQPAAFLDCF